MTPPGIFQKECPKPHVGIADWASQRSEPHLRRVGANGVYVGHVEMEIFNADAWSAPSDETAATVREVRGGAGRGGAPRVSRVVRGF